MFYKFKKFVVLVVNKVDNFEMCNDIYDFYFLGFGDLYFIFGLYGLGFGDLLDVVVENFNKELEDFYDEDMICFFIIGRFNVGKFSLVNVILGEECVIVFNVVGIIWDVIDIEYFYDG